MSVHDIKMNHVASRLFHHADACRKIGEISGKNGRRDEDSVRGKSGQKVFHALPPFVVPPYGYGRNFRSLLLWSMQLPIV